MNAFAFIALATFFVCLKSSVNIYACQLQNMEQTYTGGYSILKI